MQAKESLVFTLLVDNEFGVLTRITALIRRMGWNIRSLAVAETAVPERSRLTICLECRQHTLEQVIERLGRLDCVHDIALFSQQDQVARELVLLHLEAGSSAQALCERHGATVVRQAEGGCILSLICEPGELDALLPSLSGQGLVEIARTGAVALRLGLPKGDGSWN